MFKKLLTLVAAFSFAGAFAAVDVNKATEAELDGIKGIGPATTALIVAERKKAEFKNWDDFIARVKGLGDKTAAKFSAEGMTVGGAPYLPSTKTEVKVAAKKDEMAAASKPAASAASAAKK